MKRTRSTGDMRGWTVHKRTNTESVYYVVIATKLVKHSGERAKSKLLASDQCRHSLTLTRQRMDFITVHAESGGSAVQRDRRASQLQYLARAHESANGGACFLVGDFNLRQGEDQVLLNEGWRDSACEIDDVVERDDWTWAGGKFRARYDRVYTHAGVAKLAKVPHTHLKVIATPKECQGGKKQRPEAPRSSAQKRPGNMRRRQGEKELTNVWDIYRTRYPLCQVSKVIAIVCV